MPAPSGTKRVKGKSVYRPFVYGSSAVLLPKDPAKRPPNTPVDHTHQWTVYVRGIDGADITYWLKKVQFKLHETYTQSQRTIEAPQKFEVTETGWGEFEVGIKLFFHPDSGEKSQSIYHQLKLHHFTETKEADTEANIPVISQLYEEVVFNEPAENFYNTLTEDPSTQHKSGSKTVRPKPTRSAELPAKSKDGFDLSAEQAELHKLKEAQKQIEKMIAEERDKALTLEKELLELKKPQAV